MLYIIFLHPSKNPINNQDIRCIIEHIAKDITAPMNKQIDTLKKVRNSLLTSISELSVEQLNALKDLHWLNSEGYVIEYADGLVFIGVTDPPPAKPKAVKAAPVKILPEENASAKTEETPIEQPAVELENSVAVQAVVEVAPSDAPVVEAAEAPSEK